MDLEITSENKQLLTTEYEARTAKELPVLTRFFRASEVGSIPVANYLDIILYSRDQIKKENISMGNELDNVDAPYGIISIKPQNVNNMELPMQPITMMRNALGKDQGGSGVPLEREKYIASCEYWAKHASVKY